MRADGKGRLRWTWLMWGAGLIAMLGSDAGCSTKFCGGQILCAEQEGHCDSVPGCAPVPACQFSFANTDSVCERLGTQPSCEAATGSACRWTSSRCDSICGSIDDAQQCHDFSFIDPRYPDRNYPCAWSTCSGIPAKSSCGDYPTDQCPAQLGCVVTDKDPVGT